MSARLHPKHEFIAFVDGECVLCNRWVSFLAKHDKKKRIRFSALQGKTAHETLPGELITGMSTIVYLRKGKIFLKSGAAIRMLSDSAWYWKVSLIFLIFPSFLRNYIYDFVASKRFDWFGRKPHCSLTSMPDKEQVLP